jgi:hypothetical protein
MVPVNSAMKSIGVTTNGLSVNPRIWAGLPHPYTCVKMFPSPAGADGPDSGHADTESVGELPARTWTGFDIAGLAFGQLGVPMILAVDA